MKARYKDKIFATYSDVEDAVQKEVDKKIDEIYDNAKKDIIAQLFSVCLLELSQEFGFGKQRLEKFMSGINDRFRMMDSGILGKGTNTEECVALVKAKYGIDLDEMIN